MKNLFLSFTITAISLCFVNAQSNIYFENEAPEATFNAQDGPIIETDTIRMINNNTDTIVVDWLIRLEGPQQESPDSSGYLLDAWSVLLCDELLCWGVPNAQSVIPPNGSYGWKLNISGSIGPTYYLIPGEGILYFDAIDTLKQDHIAKFAFKITIVDSTNVSIENYYDDKITVYPSPANEIVNISILENTEIEQLSINNLNGANVLTQPINLGNSFETININEQPSGSYLFVFKDKNGIPLYSKMMNKK